MNGGRDRRSRPWDWAAPAWTSPFAENSARDRHEAIFQPLNFPPVRGKL